MTAGIEKCGSQSSGCATWLVLAKADGGGGWLWVNDSCHFLLLRICNVQLYGGVPRFTTAQQYFSVLMTGNGVEG
jgi:hypothetical protein